MREFVPYQEALELKNLGFDEPCFAYFEDFEDSNSNVRLRYIEHEDTNPLTYKNCSSHQDVLSPLYQQAFRWFREKYGLHCPIQISSGIWSFEKFNLSGFKTYEEAEVACLRKLIEIVKQSK